MKKIIDMEFIDPTILSEPEIERYSRQLILKNWGLEKQSRLKNYSVGIDGSLGVAALYLAAAGIGKIVFIEHQSSINKYAPLIKSLNPLVSVCDENKNEGFLDLAILRDNREQFNTLSKKILTLKLEFKDSEEWFLTYTQIDTANLGQSDNSIPLGKANPVTQIGEFLLNTLVAQIVLKGI